MDSDRQRGLYNKFHVTRADGSSKEGGKHEHCEYFVLDLNHDQFARTALSAYSVACKGRYPQLSADLIEMLGCISTADKAIIDSLCAPETYGTEDETPALDRLSVMSGLSMVSRRAQHAYALMGDGKTAAVVEVIDSIEAELAYIRAKLREGGVIP